MLVQLLTTICTKHDCIVLNAGAMLGAWPCGIIVLLGELFGSESLSQVYALLHTFFLKNSSSTQDIRKYCKYSHVKCLVIAKNIIATVALQICQQGMQSQ